MIHDSYFIMIIMIHNISEELSGISGGSQRIWCKFPGGTGGNSRGVPSIPLSSIATWTSRAGDQRALSLPWWGTSRTTGALQKELFFAVHPPHNLGKGYGGVSKVFRVEYEVQDLLGHIGEPHVSGIAPGTFGGSVYTLRTSPRGG